MDKHSIDAWFSAELTVIEAVAGSMTQEERDFGSLPNGQMLGRYALESLIELVSTSSDTKGEFFG